MAIDLLAAVLFIGFVTLGAIRGTLASGVRIVVLLVAYVVAYFAGTLLGGPVAAATGLFSLLAAAAAGAVAFVGTFVILTVVAAKFLRRDRKRHYDYPRSILDRVGGGTVGAAQGVFVALLLGWLGLWVDAGRATGSFEFDFLSGPSIVRSASQNVIATGARAALGDAPTGRVGTNLLSNPAETVVSMQKLLDNPRISLLQSDLLFWHYVSTGALDQALNRSSFLGITHDATLRGQLVDLGIVGEPSRHDPRLFRNATKDLLRRSGPALRDLRNDPELRKLAQDPEIQNALRTRDTFTLLAHPGFQRVFARVLASTESN